jgi:hypothetical protein
MSLSWWITTINNRASNVRSGFLTESLRVSKTYITIMETCLIRALQEWICPRMKEVTSKCSKDSRRKKWKSSRLFRWNRYLKNSQLRKFRRLPQTSPRKLLARLAVEIISAWMSCSAGIDRGRSQGSCLISAGSLATYSHAFKVIQMMDKTTELEEPRKERPRKI